MADLMNMAASLRYTVPPWLGGYKCALPPRHPGYTTASACHMAANVMTYLYGVASPVYCWGRWGADLVTLPRYPGGLWYRDGVSPEQIRRQRREAENRRLAPAHIGHGVWLGLAAGGGRVGLQHYPYWMQIMLAYNFGILHR